MGLFAQTTYTYDYNDLTVDETTFLGFSLAALFFTSLIIWVVSIIALWKVFEKAGVEGWKAIIPFYNYWVLCEIAGRPGWWALSFIFAVIPILNIIGWIVPLVVWIIVALDIGKAFGKSTTFSVVALIVFSLIGLLILGFGSDKYKKPPTHKSHGSAVPAS